MMSKRPPKNLELRWIWIMAMLRSRGTSFAQVARDLGVSRHAVLHLKHRKCPHIEQAIAASLDMQPADIWPDRYPDVAKRKDEKLLAS